MRPIKDRLAHLSFRRACQLLGPQGESLLRRGGKYDIDIDLQVTWRDRWRGSSAGMRQSAANRGEHTIRGINVG
jgi:hypothetical protein